MKNKNYIIAIDQSTSASKVMLFDKSASLVRRVSLPHQQFYPQQGFVEHDAEEIFNNVVTGIKQVVEESSVSMDEVAGISITNQRETAVIWDKNTGLPVGNAAVWQCQRGKEFCNELHDKGFSKLIRKKTGLLLDPYFSASKLHWLMGNIKGLKQKAQEGKLLWGTMDSWLLWKLTNGKVHATDYSNACRTMLFNIKTLKWDKELIDLFGLYESMFPQVKPSNEIFGHTDSSVLFDTPLPIAGLLGDSHGALVGQNCFKPGMAKTTYGTGSSLMMNIGDKPLDAPEGLVTSIGYGMDNKINYVFEGNIHCTGDTINWLKNELQLITNAQETEKEANSVADNNGVYFVPAFVGLGAPYWDNNARACISGMARNTTKAHIIRAGLESIAYQVKDLISLMGDNGGIPLQSLYVDGGPTQNNFLMQFQADILNLEVSRSDIEEVSALGATYMAGLAFKFWQNLDKVKSLKNAGHKFFPKMEKGEINQLYGGWKKAVERARL